MSEETKLCPHCMAEPHQCVCPAHLDWDGDEDGHCGMCDGSGKIDAFEDDPNWYHPGELKPCPQCGGTGK